MHDTADINPYAPPNVPVADPAPEATAVDETPFFAVSPLKLVVMSVTTWGLYELFWFYCQWRKIRDRERQNIRPFWRAFFAYFFCYQCFRNIRYHGGAEGATRGGFPPGACAAGWIVLTLLGRAPEPVWLLSFASVFLLLPVQQHANRLNAMAVPRHDRNARFTALDALAIVGGLILGSAVFAGM